MLTQMELAKIGEFEHKRLTKTRARHARETNSKMGALQGISSELLRQAKCIGDKRPELIELITNGSISVDRAYRITKGDNRQALFVKISPELKERLKDEAYTRGCTMSELVSSCLTKIFG